MEYVKVRLSGLSKFSNTLHVELPRQVDWKDLTGLLSINGAEYYRVGKTSVSIRRSKTVATTEFTAQCLRTIIRPLGVNIEELAIDIRDYHVRRASVQDLAINIWSRTAAIVTPSALPLERVEARGTGPAYWPR